MPPWNPTLAHRTRKDGAPLGVFWVGEIKVKTGVKGSGQECPLHTSLSPYLTSAAEAEFNAMQLSQR
jgi:hypothetical protein